MNNSLPASVGDVREDALCETCSHPLTAHDAMGLRWCAATKLGVGTRKCMCSGVQSEARVLTFY
jgi:hypothetical protein